MEQSHSHRKPWERLVAVAYPGGGGGSGCSSTPISFLLNAASGLRNSVLYVSVDISAKPRAGGSCPDLSDSRACTAYPAFPATRRAVCRPLSPPTSSHSS